MKNIKYLVFVLLLFFSCRNQNQERKGGQDDTSAELKTLKVYYANSQLLNKENPSLTETITTSDLISNQNKLKVEVEPKSATAKVYFDSSSSHSLINEYLARPVGGKVTIKVEDGLGSSKKEKTYILNVSEDIGLGEIDSIKCNVTNFVGGMNVPDATIDVFKSGKNTKLTSSKTDINGCVFFKLARGGYYDFVVSKEGMAASRVENVYVEEGSNVQTLPIVQRKRSVGKKAIAPTIARVQHFVRPGGTANPAHFIDVTNKYSLNSSEERYRYGGFLVTVDSPSGEIIPEKIGTISHGLNYGIGMNIGGRFSMQQQESYYSPNFIPVSNGSSVFRDPSTGVVTQKVIFDLRNVNFPSEERAIIYIIAYDIAGNRCERHLNVKLIHDDIISSSSINMSKFKVLFERFTGEMNTFGLNEHDGFGTSYRTAISFAFDNDVQMSALDIYRREYTGQADINADWEMVDRRVFKEAKHKNTGELFNEADNSLSLEEGITYQYKITVYLNVNDRLEKVNSPVATTKILPAFNIKLVFPAPNEQIELNKILQDGMKFKMSNIDCWKIENADYFVFGVLLLRDEIQGVTGDPLKDNKQKNGARFASILRYNFNKTGDEVLEVKDDSNNWIAIMDNLSDIFSYDNGEITLKKRFFDNGAYNLIEGKKLSEVLKSGEMYYWDVQDWGRSALSVRDDKPASFTKEWKPQDSKTGLELQGTSSFGTSASNLLRGGNAVNGRVAFTIK